MAFVQEHVGKDFTNNTGIHGLPLEDVMQTKYLDRKRDEKFEFEDFKIIKATSRCNGANIQLTSHQDHQVLMGIDSSLSYCHSANAT